MPNLRSIPTFPKTMEYKKGFTWTAPAQEIMKFQKLLVIPLEVQYEYRGSSVLSTPEGVKKLHKILINYEISKEFREADNQTPSKVFGFVTGILFFDDAAKIPYYEQSEYNLVILFPNGDSREFNVKSKTYYKKIPHTKKTIEAKELAKEFRKKLIPEKGDVNPKIRIRVRKDEVKINLPNVFFETDSAELTDESKEALDSIIKIIKEKAPNAQIVIRGFTDNRGSEEYNLKLSEKRAKAVADYLVEEGELKPENISYLGLGEKRPIASNRTAEGRAKNRRVEVLIYP
ncbi:MAG: OmpA family protein [Candidatus Hydrogenedentota bacterium]|nr:MAG: OmpA family protein [Candidatus Hydrogenedentota bacterium]